MKKMQKLANKQGFNFEGREDFIAKTNWSYVFWDIPMSEEFMHEFINYIPFNKQPYSLQLSEKFIRQHSDKVNWRRIIGRKDISNNFIKECCPLENIAWAILPDKTEYPNLNDAYPNVLWRLGDCLWLGKGYYEVSEISCDNKLYYVEPITN